MLFLGKEASQEATQAKSGTRTAVPIESAVQVQDVEEGVAVTKDIAPGVAVAAVAAVVPGGEAVIAAAMTAAAVATAGVNKRICVFFFLIAGMLSDREPCSPQHSWATPPNPHRRTHGQNGIGSAPQRRLAWLLTRQAR